jgi:hypothetical protein
VGHALVKHQIQTLPHAATIGPRLEESMDSAVELQALLGAHLHIQAGTRKALLVLQQRSCTVRRAYTQR